MAHALDRRQLILVATLVVAVLVSPAQAQQAVPFRGDRTVTVMTRNLYIGVDESPLFTALPEEIPFLVAELFQKVLATDFPARAQALADEIAIKQPDLIGLQEVSLFRIQSPGDALIGNTPATTVALDFLAVLLSALSDRGLAYTVVAETNNIDVEVPIFTGSDILDDIRVTDRDIILARADLKTADLKLSNPQAGNFAAQLPIPLAGQYVPIPRGWAAVDVKVRGKSFRFVTTHLESFSPIYQVIQGNELLLGPANTNLPVVMVGDFNSDAEPTGSGPDKTLTYQNLINAGFVDAWSQAGLGPVFTCCQAEDLRNEASSLNERIDLVLFRGQFTVTGADIVGEALADRTPSGLWPSDHAGVAATLQFR
jgi:endonuclease/exonuclease/phosphatase family metal-dependent hydrolase